ncbi:MAG: arginine--tRNA ligase [Patescibacteria group bacterium]|jgi:arginyl-tRNA synthetase
MQRLRDRLEEEFTARMRRLFPEHAEHLPKADVSYPADSRYGEYALSIAMQLAPILKMSPMDIAQKLAAGPKPGAFVARVDVVHPGYINVSLDREWLTRFIKKAIKEKKAVWELKEKPAERVHLEYISANPTGPLTAGNGRGGFMGDVIARVLTALGKKVHREYYFNDAGKQIDTLAESVIRRYLEKRGIPVAFTDELYQGEYIRELAEDLDLDHERLDDTKRLRNKIRGRAVRKMMTRIKHSLKMVGIVFDRYFSESELHDRDLLEKMLKRLGENGMVYEKDGATWVRTTRFGDDKDRVVVKSDGTTTYFYADIAYLWEKFKIRRFDRAILLLGADHHGFVPRLQAARQALDLTQPLDVLIFQLVRILQDGKEVRMSKRQGTFITLEEVMEEVGPDAARFFFLMYTADRHMDFDLDLAKKQSKENPVYYLQYAYTRVQSLLSTFATLSKRKAAPLKKQKPGELSERARRLVVLSLRFPEILDDVGRTYEVHRLANFALEYAEAFHLFYDTERIIENDVSYDPRRLEIVQMSDTILTGILDLLGLSKPKKM